MVNINSKKKLDKEWVELIKQALEMGITISEIREFLNKSGTDELI